VLVACISVFATVLGWARPVFSKVMIDEALLQHNLRVLVGVVALMLVKLSKQPHDAGLPAPLVDNPGAGSGFRCGQAQITRTSSPCRNRSREVRTIRTEAFIFATRSGRFLSAEPARDTAECAP
jgi:hypothetical protein